MNQVIGLDAKDWSMVGVAYFSTFVLAAYLGVSYGGLYWIPLALLLSPVAIVGAGFVVGLCLRALRVVSRD